jgi:hypothetical protein
MFHTTVSRKVHATPAKSDLVPGNRRLSDVDLSVFRSLRKLGLPVQCERLRGVQTTFSLPIGRQPRQVRNHLPLGNIGLADFFSDTLNTS